MRKMAYIVSVKYAAGSHKEFVLMGRKLKEHGIEVRYLLSSRYRWMHKEPPDETFFITDSSNLRTMLTDSAGFLLWRWAKLLSLLKIQRPDFLCIYNAHPLNPFIAGLIKRNFPQAITALYLHDPYKPDKSPYGFKKSIYIKLVEVIQKRTVRYMDYVISPS